MTAERQNRVVVLLNVNVCAATQTDRHVRSASPRPVPASRPSPRLPSEFCNGSILRLFGMEASISLALA
jgi:hypothetical protein